MMSGIGGMGGLDPSQMKARMAQRADSNGDGAVDKAELESMLTRAGKKTDQSLDVAAMMEQYDADGSGSLNQDETVTMMSTLRDEMGPQQGRMGMSGNYGGGADRFSSLLEMLQQDDDEQDTKNTIESFFQNYQPINTIA